MSRNGSLSVKLHAWVKIFFYDSHKHFKHRKYISLECVMC
jgi:hypothetical protein